MELTEQQKAVLHYIREYIRTTGYAPSIREVASGTKLRSQSSACHHLRTLERLGYIRRDVNVPRGLVLLPSPDDVRFDVDHVMDRALAANEADLDKQQHD